MRFGLLTIFAVALAGGSSAAAQHRTEPKARPLAVTISVETTRITGPLRKDGYVDYVAAIEQRFRAGVTPENNAAAAFLKIMGPGAINPQHRDEYCRRLGIPRPPDEGDYFISLESYVQRREDAEKAPADAEGKGYEFYRGQLTAAMEQPWSSKEYPVLAGWLVANEKELDLLIEAAERPRRYDPLISSDGIAIAVLLPMLNQYREAGRALTARAMRRVGEGQVDAAWGDLLACHRLARLVGQGPNLVDALVAIAVDGLACGGDRGLLRHARLKPAQIARMRADLDNLPPMPRMVEKIDVAERYMYLDCVAVAARKGATSFLAELSEGLSGVPQRRGFSTILVDILISMVVDWDVPLRMGNAWYDRHVEACGKPTRAERQAALSKLDGDLHMLRATMRDGKSLGRALLRNPQHAISEWMGGGFVRVLMPALWAAASAEERVTLQFELTRLAFALAAYRADRGAYPAGLAELGPQYAPKSRKGILVDAELHYGREGDGYLLYSFGVNGKDDGGRSYEDCRAGEGWDDLAVRTER